MRPSSRSIFIRTISRSRKKSIFLAMVRSGVLQIHPEMIHPVDRNVIGSSSILQVVAYNRKLLADAKAPDSWEDFLKPEFKGKKFLADIRPFPLACLVPLWGLEKNFGLLQETSGAGAHMGERRDPFADLHRRRRVCTLHGTELQFSQARREPGTRLLPSV